VIVAFDLSRGGDDDGDDPFDAWRAAVGPWRPRPLSRPDAPMPRARRAALLLAIVLGHALVVWLLVLDSLPKTDDTDRVVTTIVFVAPEPPVVVPVPATPAPSVPETAPAPLPRPPMPARVEPRPARAAAVEAPPVETPAVESPVVADAATPAADALVAVEPTPRDGATLSLYDADGSLALPDDVVARIGDVEAPTREFDFQLPGLMESGRFMERQPVLAYESTRFDKYWIPEKDVLTKILEKAVKATTGTVEIPIPGTRGGKLVCSVSILALGGGCGVRNNSNGYVVRGDDPATLSPEEDAQCKAWWDQIVEADDQDGWRHTRDLYDFSCRKPLAKDLSPPE
jgi:hypothetical protein